MDKSNIIYDFDSPGHKLNTRWPVLDLLSIDIAASFSLALADKLQLQFDTDASPSKCVKYSDCLESMGNTCVVYEMSIKPLAGFAWFCMDTSIISSIVESYFGGNGNVVPLETPRELTRTELRVLTHITSAVQTGISSGWEMVMPVDVSLSRRMDTSWLANAAMQPVLIVSEMALKLGEIELPCQLVYPYEMLEPHSTRLQHEVTETSRPDTGFSAEMKRELMHCEIDLQAVLAETQIALGKVLGLKPGYFIPLRDVQNVSFKTNNMPLFDARVGSSNGRVSASLSRWHLPVAS